LGIVSLQPTKTPAAISRVGRRERSPTSRLGDSQRSRPSFL
jgi:hypothetical protein